MTLDLFDAQEAPAHGIETFAPGACVLRRYALQDEQLLLAAMRQIIEQAPLRHWTTPGGYRMSVAMTNCGGLGWISDRRGYRYDAVDPDSDRPWPSMPNVFLRLAASAAAEAGYEGFVPDACLINRYEAGTKLSLHQDRDELDWSAPIVSVSLGLPAVFLFGGLLRADPTQRVPLAHGDVVVWGGPSRLRFHGVMPVKPGFHGLLGGIRMNLTFRKVR